MLAGVDMYLYMAVEMYLARHDGLFLADGGADRFGSCGYSLWYCVEVFS